MDRSAGRPPAHSQRLVPLLRRAVRAGLVGLVRFYQRGISPLIGPCCRFTPTCSQYAVEAIEQYGAWHGSLRAIRRILRCHPWNPGGYDPP